MDAKQDDPDDERKVFPTCPNPPQNMQGTSTGIPVNQSSGVPESSRSPQTSPSIQYNWQATKPTVKSRLAFLLNNEALSDIRFLVGRGASKQRIPAHRFVLSMGSAVFDAMFNSSLATTCDEVELPDIEPAAFHSLLKFVYTDEVQIGPETVMTTLYTAKKYAIPALEKACVEFLQSNLCSDNAFLLLAQARLFDEPQLVNLCLESIDKNTANAFSADGFIDVDLDTLCCVLERSTLTIRETKVFEAAVRWAEAECRRQQIPILAKTLRSVLGRAVFLIRFPLMSVEEFARGAAQSGLLTDQEIVQLFLYFTLNPKPSIGFVDTPRGCLADREQTVNRFTQVESRWGYNGNSDRVRFLTDRHIFVRGFGLYGSVHCPAEYDAKVVLIHHSGEVVGSHKTTFTCDGSSGTFRVMFEEPVEIEANVMYTIAATLTGPDSYYGTKGLSHVTLDCPVSGRTTFHFSYAQPNNNGTSVEDGQIPEIIFYTG